MWYSWAFYSLAALHPPHTLCHILSPGGWHRKCRFRRRTVYVLAMVHRVIRPVGMPSCPSRFSPPPGSRVKCVVLLCPLACHLHLTMPEVAL